MDHKTTFQATLTKHYRELFAKPDYAMAARLHTPETLAEKMTNSLQAGTANKDGDGIKRTCKELGIAYTYKAIAAYFAQA
jgi:hypothetical protein